MNKDISQIESRAIDGIFEFKRWGDTFTRVAYNPDTDVFIFRRVNSQGRVICLEVVKPRPHKGVRCYPSSEDFGVYGFDEYNTPAGRAKAARLLMEGW